jgi:hypothetical protein
MTLSSGRAKQVGSKPTFAFGNKFADQVAFKGCGDSFPHRWP